MGEIEAIKKIWEKLQQKLAFVAPEDREVKDIHTKGALEQAYWAGHEAGVEQGENRSG